MQPKLVLFTVVGVSFSEPRFAFETIVPRDDSTLFLGYRGLLPAVTGAENHGEAYDHVGDSRTVHLSDGGTFREEIVRYVRPAARDAAGDPARDAAATESAPALAEHPTAGTGYFSLADPHAPGDSHATTTQRTTGYFDYDATRFTGILARIVSDGTARWTYAPGTPGRTRITWTYGYRPLPGRTFLVQRVIGPLWLRYMRRSMGNVLAAIAAERRAAAMTPATPQTEARTGERGPNA